MKHSIDHLTDEHKTAIETTVTIIRSNCNPEKIVLFDIHSSGECKANAICYNEFRTPYTCDYNFLIIAKSGEQISEHTIATCIENNGHIRLGTSIFVISHDIPYINNKLSVGQHFFAKIINEGILVYDASGIPLSAIGIPDWANVARQAQNDLDIWLNDAKSFLSGARFFVAEANLRIALFCLHQAAEGAYNAILCVFRGYKPKTHNLNKLYRHTKAISARLPPIFPFSSDWESRLFDQLRKGYVEARYNKHFIITETEIEALMKRIGNLHQIAFDICTSKITAFKNQMS